MESTVLATVLDETKKVHKQLETIEELYATIQNNVQLNEYEQYATDTYYKAKEALEHEAVRLDALLQEGGGGETTEFDAWWNTPHIKFVKLLEVLAELNVNPSSLSYDTLIKAVVNNDCRMVLFLLETADVDPSAYDNYAIQHACCVGHTDIVRLLLADPRVDPTMTYNKAFGWAAEKGYIEGYIEIVRLLLDDGRADPKCAFHKACKNGHTEIVRLLLADPRVDPNANDSSHYYLTPIHDAIQSGHTDVVRLLLADPRVHILFNTVHTSALRHACSSGQTEIVRLLLADPRVDPAKNRNDAIYVASAFGHTEVVRLLLADPRVNPAADDNDAIIEACHAGHKDVVRLLLQDPRVNPAAQNNSALIQACTCGRTEVVRMLLAWSSGTTRVDPTQNDYEAIRSARIRNHMDIVHLLLDDPRVDIKTVSFLLGGDDPRLAPSHVPLEQ